MIPHTRTSSHAEIQAIIRTNAQLVAAVKAARERSEREREQRQHEQGN